MTKNREKAKHPKIIITQYTSNRKNTENLGKDIKLPRIHPDDDRTLFDETIVEPL